MYGCAAYHIHYKPELAHAGRGTRPARSQHAAARTACAENAMLGVAASLCAVRIRSLHMVCPLIPHSFLLRLPRAVLARWRAGRNESHGFFRV
eukprot:COSAG05_NODE_635_length_8192_cov_14.964043_5_plen_93_part_00